MASDDREVCPLCMEPMEADDLAFYPCDCRYQVCRFCWAKIINEENGLCPACRKEYNSEKPAQYKPVSETEDAKLRATRKRKENLKKNKLSAEMLKLLPELRVVQPNLIFVVGLPAWICKDKEVLKGSEYFGRYGKVFKVEINQNQTFGGPQGQPTFSAYITFCRSEDAMRSIKELDQGMLHGRPLRVSLGTTKYCSQFLRGTKCTKHECMYLHELGDPAASFTKEEMQAGKHTEYMNKLLKEYPSSSQQQSVTATSNQQTGSLHLDSAISDSPTNTLPDDSGTHLGPSSEVTQCANSARGRTRSGGTTDRPSGSSSSSKVAGYNGIHYKPTSPDGPSSHFNESRRQRLCRTDRPFSEVSSSDGNVTWNRQVSTPDYIPNDEFPRGTNGGRQASHSFTHSHVNGIDVPDRERLYPLRGPHKMADSRRSTTYYHRSEHVRQGVPGRKQNTGDQFHTVNSNSNCPTSSISISEWNHAHSSNSEANKHLGNIGDDAIDIGFDPFRESQQGLAELLASEVSKLVVEETPHACVGVNGHLPLQGRGLSRSYATDGSCVPTSFTHQSQSRHLNHWFSDFAATDTQTSGFKRLEANSMSPFNSCVFPPPGFEADTRDIAPPSSDPSMFVSSTSNLSEFIVGDSPRASGAPFILGPNSCEFTRGNVSSTEESSPFSHSANLSSPSRRLDTTQFESDTQVKPTNISDSCEATPMLNGPSAIFPSDSHLDNTSPFRPDPTRPNPQQMLSQLLATAFNAASGIINNSRVQANAEKSPTSSSRTVPSFDLAAFLNYLYRLSPLFSSLNPQFSSEWVNEDDNSRPPVSNNSLPEGLIDSSAVLSAAASVLFPAAAAAVQLQSKSNEFLSTCNESPQPPSASKQHDCSSLSSQGFTPGLHRQAPLLQQTAFSDSPTEMGGSMFSTQYGKSSSRPPGSDSYPTWQLDDPAIVSSQVNSAASSSHTQTDADWKPPHGPVSPVDLIKQLWRSGSNVPLFDGHVAPSYSNFTAQSNNASNSSTTQRQTIRESSLHSTSQTD